MTSTPKQSSGPIVYIVSHELVKISSLLPSNRNRSLVVHSLISSLGLLTARGEAKNHAAGIRVVKPTRARPKDLAEYHTQDYLDFVLNKGSVSIDPIESSASDEGAQFGLEDDCPPFIGLANYVQLIAGASLLSANLVRQGKASIAICWDGGRHHAQKSHAAGFCYVADCVLALLALKRPLAITPGMQKPRVMYLDLDLHFSDAVSQAFYSSGSTGVSQVLTLSIHHTSPGFFPISHLSFMPNVDDPAFDPFTLSIPLRQGASNSTFARIWPIVEQTKDIFEPNFILIQCGVDGLAGDPCATWNWALGGEEGSMGWCVDRIARIWKGRKVFLGGGGYNSANAARAWAYLTSIALGQPLDLEMPIPDHAGFLAYAPSFTLDVPAGNMPDLNGQEYLERLDRCFELALGVMRKRLAESAP